MLFRLLTTVCPSTDKDIAKESQCRGKYIRFNGYTDMFYRFLCTNAGVGVLQDFLLIPNLCAPARRKKGLRTPPGLTTKQEATHSAKVSSDGVQKTDRKDESAQPRRRYSRLSCYVIVCE